jgi:uracil-DNA glycosylase family 4
MELAEKQAKLEQIADSIMDRSIGIEIAETCTNPVPGEGNPDAKILFIGEAPGAQEDKLGRPFVGASGKFLDEMLASIGLKRSDVFITNIVKFRPPDNRDPKPDEIKACLPILLKQINVIEPKVIVFLGRHSMNVFFPGLKISEAHGQPISATAKNIGQISASTVFLPLYHPAAALYNGGMRQTLIEDFAKIPHILELIK